MSREEHDGSQRVGVLAEVAGSAWTESTARGVTEKSMVIDRAYDEYCRRRELGETPDPDTFCRDFPFQSSLRRLLEADRFLQENPQLLERERPIRWPETGEYFLGFILHRELGRGSFARVFLATEPALGNRRVAVKFALHGGAEAETLGRLQHPNIVSVHSVQKDPASGLTAVCMPYLGGANLCHLLDRLHSGLPTTAAVIQQTIDEARPTGEAAPSPCWTKQESYVAAVTRIGGQLADGLASIHDQGICHRDLKPSNVLLAANGQAMLLDFNLSFDAHASEQRLGGTLPYMSPEHLAATDVKPTVPASAVDARSDLFSLGVLLYELLAGEHPFGPVSLKLSAEEVRAHLRRRHREGPRPLRQINPGVNKSLSRVIERCLEADPEERPQSAAELAGALRSTQPLISRARHWAAGHKRAVAAIAVMVLCAGTAGALGSYGMTPATANPVNLSAQEWADRGWKSFEGRRYDEAVECLTAAMSADDKNWEWAYRLGWAHLRKGDVESLLKAEKCFGAADDLYGSSNAGQTHNGRVLAALGYCLSLGYDHAKACGVYNSAAQAGFNPAELQNNLGYSYVHSRTADNMFSNTKAAETAFNVAILKDPNLQAAYYNRATLHVNDLGKYSRFEPDSPYEDLRKAIELGKGAGRDTGRLYYDAARIHGTAADLLTKRARQAFASSEYPFGTEPFGPIGSLLGKAGLFLTAQDEVDFHRKMTVDNARRALERGFDSEKLAGDLKIQPFLKEIGRPQLTVPIADINSRLVDLVPDFGK
jgi:eukaryotic-like serine/threonine-protein kinase